MFVALRDLRHARGRFAVMLTVIVLITFMVTFLAALTAGLSRQSTSAITELPADHLTFALPAVDDKPDFTSSAVSVELAEQWAAVPGVRRAVPLGLATTRAQAESTAVVTALGVPPQSGLLPADLSDPASGSVVLSAEAADNLAVVVGESITMAGQDFRVAAVSSHELSYAHTPVVWTSLADWQSIGGRSEGAATVLALTTDGTVPVEQFDQEWGTTTVATAAAVAAIGSYAAENGSLTIMQVMLMLISAMVVGAFFTVWTMSRTTEVAVLKALGSSTGTLLRDALGQAAVVLGLGIGVGAAAAAGGAGALAAVVPVVVSPSTVLVPAVLLLVMGLLGSSLAILRITRVDPHAALAAR